MRSRRLGSLSPKAALWLKVACGVTLVGSALAATAFVLSIVGRSTLIASSGVLNADRFKSGALTWLLIMAAGFAASAFILFRSRHGRDRGKPPTKSALESAMTVLNRSARPFSHVKELDLAKGQVQQMKSQRDMLEAILSASTSPDAWPDLHRLFDAMETQMAVNCKKLATYAVSNDRQSMQALLDRNGALLDQAGEANRKVTTLVAEEQGDGNADLKIRSYLDTLDSQVRDLEWK
ncbi:hypothetical protein [Xylanimonas sp. McL0601]|uniref:hypothetical protein n=1 Tax=Xylanimonas sp. McL0601 TaxID=3414739 RepID=UPI003CF564E6